MKQGTREFLIQCIIFILGITTLCLPNDMYFLKIIGIILFNVLVWRNQIKRLLPKHDKKKDNESEK